MTKLNQKQWLFCVRTN